MTEPDFIQIQLEGLNTSVAQLSAATVELTQRQSVQLATVERTQKQSDQLLTKLSRLIKYAIITGIISILVFAGLAWKSIDNSNRIQRNTDRTSSEVLCPLWSRFLRSYNTESPQAKADSKAYEESFKDIEKGARTLGCKQTKRGIVK